MIDKYKSPAICVQIGRIVMSDWDPIGVRYEPLAQDEYDGYLGAIFELLVSNASEDKLADYLYSVETVSMGLTDGDGNAFADRRVFNAVAGKLQQMFASEMQSVE